MNTDKAKFEGKHSQLSGVILRAYYDVYNELGSGFTENIYHLALVSALVEAGLKVTSQAPIPVYFRERVIALYRADIIVEGKILLELKAIQVLDRNHFAQVLNYLKATLIEVAFLMNFGSKPEYKRIMLDNELKKIRVDPCESAVVL